MSSSRAVQGTQAYLRLPFLLNTWNAVLKANNHFNFDTKHKMKHLELTINSKPLSHQDCTVKFTFQRWVSTSLFKIMKLQSKNPPQTYSVVNCFFSGHKSCLASYTMAVLTGKFPHPSFNPCTPPVPLSNTPKANFESWSSSWHSWFVWSTVFSLTAIPDLLCKCCLCRSQRSAGRNGD